MRPNPTIVIIGAGVAGISAALGARSQVPEARILVYGQEPLKPYDRTSLSKQMLGEGAVIEDFPLLPDEDYDLHCFDLRLGETIASIDPETRTVTTDDGRKELYDTLVIATGASVRRFAAGPSGPGADDGLHYLRNEADALRLRSRLGKAARLVVIGGGLIGLEVAAAARVRDIDVVVLEAGPILLGRSCDIHTARVVERLHRDQGVTLRKACPVTALENRPAGQALVRLNDGDMLEADLVVAGIGVVPNIDLARDAGIDTDNGILVDACGRTSDPHIYAAGDVACLPLPGLAQPVRLETWRHAQDHGLAVGRNAAGAAAPYTKPPSFWSDQYGHRIQGVGLAGLVDTEAIVRHYGDGSHVSFLLDSDRRLVAAVGLDRPKDINAVRRLIGTDARLSPETLADTDQAITKLVKNTMNE